MYRYVHIKFRSNDMKYIVYLITALVIAINIQGCSNVLSLFGASNQFTDSRDGKTYKTVKIGDQVWMAENISHKSKGGKYLAPNKDARNVKKHGYLYHSKTAQSICPKGWHLPSMSDYATLAKTVERKYHNNPYYALIDGGQSGFNAYFSGSSVIYEWSRNEVLTDNYNRAASFWTKTATRSSGCYKCFSVDRKRKAAGFSYLCNDWYLSVRCIRD